MMSKLPCMVIVMAPEPGSSSPTNPLADATCAAVPGKYLALTRMVPKVKGWTDEM